MTSSDDEPTYGFIVLVMSLFGGSLLFFSVVAVVFTIFYVRKKKPDLDSFLTARDTQPWTRIAWSFFAGSMGAWAIVIPAQLSSDLSWLLCISYPVASAFPILVISFAGDYIKRNVSKPVVLSDYVYWRYGRACQCFFAFLAIANMSVFIISEYATIGLVYKEVVRVQNWIVIVPLGLLTMAYTAYGGFWVSIVTDHFQGILSLVLSSILAGYLFINFVITKTWKDSLMENTAVFSESKMPETFSKAALGTFFGLPLSVLAGCVFSDANWQRVWAAKSRKALLAGSLGGAALTLLVVFIFCACGYAARVVRVSNGISGEPAKASELWFLFNATGDRYSWISIFTLVLATTMNQGALDSLQNALASSLATFLLPKKSNNVRMAHFLLLLLNIPLMFAGCKIESVVQPILLINTMTACMAPAVIAGLIDTKDRVVTGPSIIFSTIFAWLAVSCHGLFFYPDAKTKLEGFLHAWYKNGFQEPLYFVTATLSPIFALMLWAIGKYLYKKTRAVFKSN